MIRLYGVHLRMYTNAGHVISKEARDADPFYLFVYSLIHPLFFLVLLRPTPPFLGVGGKSIFHFVSSFLRRQSQEHFVLRDLYDETLHAHGTDLWMAWIEGALVTIYARNF